MVFGSVDVDEGVGVGFGEFEFAGEGWRWAKGLVLVYRWWGRRYRGGCSATHRQRRCALFGWLGGAR